MDLKYDSPVILLWIYFRAWLRPTVLRPLFLALVLHVSISLGLHLLLRLLSLLLH